ncbi:MAG: penicillin-binding protein 2 [bacterium]|nr:penicillin-binding protein 2 [bacterium]
MFRTRFISACIVLSAALLLWRLYSVQVVFGSEYAERAAGQYVSASSDILSRGAIFLTTKAGEKVAGARVKQGHLLAISPDRVEGGESAFEKINSVTPVNKESFLAKVGRKGDPYEEISRRLEKETAEKILDLNLAGVYIYPDKWRFYPGQSLAAHTLGILARDEEDKLVGAYGLERYYEDVLAKDNDSIYVNFFAEIFSNITRLVRADEERVGDIITTIEPVVQTTFEKELQIIHNTYNSRITGGVIISPRTGEIYALSALPTFNSNDFKNADASTLGNPIVEDVYEFGSIVKPLTMAAGIDSGKVTAASTYIDKGFLSVDGLTISNYDGKGRGQVNMQDVLSQSLNTGVAYVVQTMGNDSFGNYIKAFGFGERTGIDLPGESRGLISNLDSTRDIEYITASFGQGIATTPIAVTRALSALANGGVLPNPHLVSRIDYDFGPDKKVGKQAGRQVFMKETADEVTRMLVKVVDEALLHGEVALPRYQIAAKTGTAQIAKQEGGGYYDDKFLHSFFGYFPAYEPEFLIFLYTVEPQGVEYASNTLTKPFMTMTKFLINYYEIPPDR